MRLQNNDFARIKRACGYNAPGMMQLSEIGGHLTARTGIDDLMEDLFKALHSGDPGLCQLNGGEPRRDSGSDGIVAAQHDGTGPGRAV